MKRTQVLNTPGSSTKEQSYYTEQAQPIGPGQEWPGPFDLDVDQDTNGSPTRPDPKPFKLKGGR